MENVQKKKVKFEWIIILGLSICLIGVFGFIVYDKIIKESKVEENQIENKVNITAEMDIRMSNFDMIENIVRLSESKEGNLFADSNMRIEYLHYVIQKNKLNGTAGLDYSQGFAYVSREIYENKYYELFGDLYNLNSDLSTMNSNKIIECSQFSDLPVGNYMCWNPVYKLSDVEYDFELTNKVLDNNTYILSGVYTMFQFNTDVMKENGTFEVKYVIKDDSFALSSVVLKKN